VQNENQRLSVALCTFNGERYLADQLRSLIEQSRRPDEVVICDDGSRDRTVQIVEQLAADAPFPVRLHRNPTKLGLAQRQD
jgi:glycosyltransferase involved in cell wall biosynthesis